MDLFYFYFLFQNARLLAMQAGQTDAMELWPKRDLGGFHQSVAFIAQ